MTDPGRTAGTIVLLMFQGFLWRAALFLTAAREPGLVVFLSGLAILAISIAWTIWWLVRGRSAIGIAVTGCLLQIGVGATALL